MNVGSLFSGIGGLDLGLERAGMRVVWQVECDPYARAVLARRFPAATLYADVREVGARNLAAVDLICGGFPCQDISNAGKRVGIEGDRSGLWSEYARIVRELRPSYVLVENVPALLGRGMERVVGDLAAGGYDSEWDCFPAAAFGAPHQRDRVYVLAYACGEGGRLQPQSELRRGGAAHPQDDGTSGSVADAKILGWQQGRQAARARSRLAGGGGALADTSGVQLQGLPPAGPDGPRRGRARLVSDAGSGRRQGGEVLLQGQPFAAGDGGAGHTWSAEPDVGRVAHGVPSRVDRLRCLGNAVVPQIAEWLGRAILRHAKGEQGWSAAGPQEVP